MEEEKQVTLDLAKPREISFKSRNNIYTYIFKRITEEAWLKYFAGMCITSERDSGGVKNTVDVATAGSDLVRSNVEGVDGYAQSFKLEGEWQNVLPVGHVKLVADWLQDAQIHEDENESPLDPTSIEVKISSAWTASEPGKMQKITGLVHRFSAPTAAHEQRYNRALSETRVVGGSRNGKTIYPSRQAVLIQLYDELIKETDGYVVNDTPLSTREQIIREMDGFHKVIAVRQLFVEPEVE